MGAHLLQGLFPCKITLCCWQCCLWCGSHSILQRSSPPPGPSRMHEHGRSNQHELVCRLMTYCIVSGDTDTAARSDHLFIVHGPWWRVVVQYCSTLWLFSVFFVHGEWNYFLFRSPRKHFFQIIFCPDESWCQTSNQVPGCAAEQSYLLSVLSRLLCCPKFQDPTNTKGLLLW